MLYNAENIALQISQILYTFVLRPEICATFELKVVQISARNTLYTKFAKFAGLNFRHFKHFVTKLCNFTSFKMLFLAIMMDFVLLAQFKI